MATYDYVVIGSGIAGLYTALLASERGRVLLLTKDSLEECNTRHAQGGIAAPIGAGDSPEAHYQDTIAAGRGLCDEQAVRVLTEEAADRISDLVQFGVPFDTVDGQIALAREGAHSMPRVLHAGGDATGAFIESTLSSRLREAGIEVREHCLATRVLVEDGVSRGVTALDCATGEHRQLECHHLVLATGGAGRLFLFTTNPTVATADGVALAYRAGAEVIDLEFFQFHPTALCLPGAPRFLISEAVRGEGGILRDRDGRAFMRDYDSKGELAGRDIVARSILAEMKRTGSECVYLDVTHLPPSTVKSRFPSIYRFCLQHGLDITRQSIPVSPAAHYQMGGVRTGLWGETSIKGLYACGEVAATGVHGANRLASNSLLEVLVFGKRIVAYTSDRVASSGVRPDGTNPSGSAFEPGNESPRQIVQEWRHHPREPEASEWAGRPISLLDLQSLMWGSVGIVRSGDQLASALAELIRWQGSLQQPASDRESWETANAVLVGRLMAEAALIREESRGSHYRTDFPQESESWLGHIVLQRPERDAGADQ